MDEPSHEPLDPALIAKRAAVADRIEHRSKRLLPLTLIFAPAMIGVGIADLVSSWVGMNWQFDVLCILIGAFGFYSQLRLRSTVRRLRAVTTRRKATRAEVVRALSSIIGATAFTLVVGYLLGGWVVGVVFVGGSMILTTLVMLRIWLVRRRRT